jgi:hypothetical protein
MASNKPDLYRSEVGYPSPTSSQNLGSKNGPNPPLTGIKIIKNPKTLKKPTFVLIIGRNPLFSMRAPKLGHMDMMWPSASP